MKVSLSSVDKNEFKKLLEIKDLNITVSDILLDAFMYVDFVNKDDLEKRISLNGSLNSSIAEIIIDNYGIDDEKLKEAIRSRISIHKCSEKLYKNEYVDLIQGRKLKYKNYNTETISYQPYQLFAVNEISVDDDYKETLNIGFFEKEFSYTALFENKDLWMSVNPNEIETMRSPILNAHGNVLVLGLGMGYISYMISQKDNVHSVTIVERNQNNIDAIKKYIGKELLANKKVKIIHADALKFMETVRDFDYIYADLWFNPEDGLLPYLTLCKLAKKNNIKIEYWLEESLKQMRRRYLIELINEQINGSDESNYQSEETDSDKIFKVLYNETKNIEIKNIEDIRRLLKWDL